MISCDGTTGIMRALIESGADVNKRGGEYGTALQVGSLMCILQLRSILLTINRHQLGPVW